MSMFDMTNELNNALSVEAGWRKSRVSAREYMAQYGVHPLAHHTFYAHGKCKTYEVTADSMAFSASVYAFCEGNLDGTMTPEEWKNTIIMADDEKFKYFGIEFVEAITTERYTEFFFRATKNVEDLAFVGHVQMTVTPDGNLITDMFALTRAQMNPSK